MKPPLRLPRGPSRAVPGTTGSSQAAPSRYATRTARDVLTQCDRCLATGTARLSPVGDLRLSTLRLNGERHLGCGGRVDTYDIRKDVA